jgi:hypothetical protein
MGKVQLVYSGGKDEVNPAWSKLPVAMRQRRIAGRRQQQPQCSVVHKSPALHAQLLADFD